MAKAFREECRGRRHDRARHGIERQHPGDLVLRRRERTLYRGQSGVGNGQIESLQRARHYRRGAGAQPRRHARHRPWVPRALMASAPRCRFPLPRRGAFVEAVRATMPELPDEKATRFVRDYGIPEYDAGVLTASREFGD